MYFAGTIAAIVTPFDERGADIDVGALVRLTQRMINGGCDGILAAGTMGEGSSLTPAERSRLVKTVVDAVQGRIPVTVGISAETADEAARRAESAAAAGARGLMCLPPTLYEATRSEILRFFAIVAGATDLPLMLYNHPEVSRSDLEPGLLSDLSEIPGVVAVKENSQRDIRRISDILETTTGRLEVLVGADESALAGLCVGATGWLPASANVAPADCVELFRACQAGRLADARAVFARLLRLARLDSSPRCVQLFKAALDGMGEYGGPSRPPRGPLDEPEIRAVREAIRECAQART